MNNLCAQKNNKGYAEFTLIELISYLKNIFKSEINIDLDLLNINIITKISDNRLHMTLDMDEIRENSFYIYYQTLMDIKRYFGPYIFSVGTALDSNTLLSKVFDECDYFCFENNATIKVYY